MTKKNKLSRVMKEYGRGTLRSGSKSGPKVKNKKQALAIGLSYQKRNNRSRRRG